MHLFIELALVAILATGCAKPSDNPGTSKTITLDKTALSIAKEGGQQEIILNAEGEWGASSNSKDWLTVKPASGLAGQTTVNVSIAANKTYTPREGEVTFRTSTNDVILKVSQEAEPEPEPDKPDPTPDMVIPEGYELVWQDEFNDDSSTKLDTKKWSYEVQPAGWVNNELQTYVAGGHDGVTTAEVVDGVLKIHAVKKGDKVYSARINSRENWLYGYFEGRIKLPHGKGTWPAFWMMPEKFTGWPGCGEIDIMEHVGCVPTEVSSSIHCQAYYHAINTQKTAARKVAGVMDEFHVYALEWTPEYIKTYVDGKALLFYNPDNYPLGRNENTWPFHVPFHYILNLAWGGDWGGMYGVDNDALPVTLEFDYVRVFQKKEN